MFKFDSWVAIVLKEFDMKRATAGWRWNENHRCLGLSKKWKLNWIIVEKVESQISQIKMSFTASFECGIKLNKHDCITFYSLGTILDLNKRAPLQWRFIYSYQFPVWITESETISRQVTRKLFQSNHFVWWTDYNVCLWWVCACMFSSCTIRNFQLMNPNIYRVNWFK